MVLDCGEVVESVEDLSAGSSDLVPSTGATAEGGSSGD